MRYDPHKEPNAEEWLATDENERLAAIEIYHREAAIEPPNELIHATLHAIIENQNAMGGDMLPVRVKIRQLMAQGLDRHEAIHAAATVLAAHMQRVVRAGSELPDSNARYLSAMRRMTARKWLRSG